MRVLPGKTPLALAGGVYFSAVAGGAGGRSPVAAAAAGRHACPRGGGGRRTPLWRFADAQGVWRYPVTLADVSPRYLQALIQYEDRWFWRHPGVNPFAVLRAAWQDLTSGRVISGGSTLTMQVARLLDPHPRTFGGKLRQLWRALQLEWHLSKSDILTSI
jgi:membrane carboxypeptidase/penicillin-binding protein PbpC